MPGKVQPDCLCVDDTFENPKNKKGFSFAKASLLLLEPIYY